MNDQSRKDAMADAETLWLVADSEVTTTSKNARLLGDAATHGGLVLSLLRKRWPDSDIGWTVLLVATGAGAENAARAAFRAVPGLRA